MKFWNNSWNKVIIKIILKFKNYSWNKVIIKIILKFKNNSWNKVIIKTKIEKNEIRIKLWMSFNIFCIWCWSFFFHLKLNHFFLFFTFVHQSWSRVSFFWRKGQKDQPAMINKNLMNIQIQFRLLVNSLGDFKLKKRKKKKKKNFENFLISL